LEGLGVLSAQENKSDRDELFPSSKIFTSKFQQNSIIAVLKSETFSLLTEKELILKCRNGDRRAQFELFNQYAKAMYNVVIRMSGNEMESKDILQEAFVKVFGKLESFEGKSTLGAWIKRIVINHAINVLKRRIETDNLDEHGAIEYEEDDEQIEGLDAKDVQHEIKQLPKGAGAIVSLYLIEGYKHREIAEMLGISESTCRSQYVRGRDILRQQLLNKIELTP
jgi:RNA polymerase sigma factor (sigma-70 family)